MGRKAFWRRIQRRWCKCIARQTQRIDPEHGFALVDFIEHRAQFVQRHRAAEQIALNEIAARTLEKLILLQALDALGDHLQMQSVGHDDDRLDDLHVRRGGGDIENERAVDLQSIQRQALV
jgi:hypothetical protein